MEAISHKSQSNEGENQPKKTCVDCGTTKTPLWRGGPAGPKSLCNACGIRSRKKRRDDSGLNEDKKATKCITTSTNDTTKSGSSSNNDSKKLGEKGLKQRLMVTGYEELMKRPRKQLREEEQAAVLLMALSYASVSA